MHYRNLRDLFFFSLVLLLSISMFLYIFIAGRRDVMESNAWVIHSYNVIISAQKMNSLPNRMLLEERSYLLTGDEAFYNSYLSTKEEMLLQVDKLEKNLQDNGEQQAQLTAIRAVFKIFSEQLDERLAVLKDRKFSMDLFMQGYDELEKTRADLATALRDFMSHEQNTVIKRTQEANDKRQEYFNTLIFVGTSAAFLILLFNVFLFYVQGKRQQAEDLLEESRRRFQIAMRGSNDSIFDYDVVNKKFFYSRQFFDLLGRLPVANGITLDDFMAIVHPDDHEHVLKNLGVDSLHQNTEYSDMYRLGHIDGRWIWVNSRGRTIVNASKKIERLVGATADVTYLRLYQEKVAAEKEQAERANAAKSAFLAHMSHEIRTPLTSINGVAEILQKNTENLSDKQKQLVHVLHTSARSMRELVTDILDFSRIESGEVELDIRTVNLGNLLREVYEITSLSAQEKGIAYNFDYKAFNTISGKYDSTRLRQVLLNLVGNAIKFTEAGSVVVTPKLIEIGGRPFLSIAVTDTGIGIADDVKDRIFEQFKQGNTFINKKYGGTGLGLTISQNLAAFMGGHIQVESVLGRGSTFELVLPHISVTQSPDDFERSQDNVPILSAADERKRVLLAEDYTGNVAVISYIFDEMGLAYDIATNGQEAVEKWQDGDYDAVLMDVQMPVMDGFTATRTIRAIEQREGLRRTPIICLTAHAIIYGKDVVLESGMDDYLTKPIFGDDLRAMLTRHLKLRHTTVSSL